MSESIDLRNVTAVEVEIVRGSDGTATIWVNVDGFCRLRVQRAENCIVSDTKPLLKVRSDVGMVRGRVTSTPEGSQSHEAGETEA